MYLNRITLMNTCDLVCIATRGFKMKQKLATKFFKRAVLVSAVLTAINSTAVSAEEATTSAQNDDKDVERIMITASKRLKGLQESPVAVTVVSGQAIEQAKILDINDLQTLVPTLRVTPLQRSVNTNFAIRGFGNGTNNTGIEPSVGVFIDGVYRSRAAVSYTHLTLPTICSV